jgi:Tol biopolymer transport system component/tRNA A-37 threonylcarbamoyl transferase component Bud32
MDAALLGKQVAHYLVVERLGQGGMGVVYKARDTHLDRFVALKVLPPDRVADPERKRRFVLEAKAASALNHPNIVHIYDIANADGIDYIAMELVEGKTLGDAIGRLGLRTDQVLKYGLQIADALAKSHAAGIIHRDLKPTNIMVTDAGLVKVLDFGLAKLTEASADEFAETRSTAAMDAHHTDEGMIVGTVAYMSPEQAQGKAVDARSDVFSLGAVLYEMVTGKPAFSRDSRLATLTAILRDQPAPMPATVPAGLRSVIHRCLVKEAAQRYQQATEVRATLEVIQDTSSDQMSAQASGLQPAVSKKSRQRWALTGAAAVVMIAAFLWLRAPARPPQLTAQRLISTFSGFHRSPSFSPDGSMIAFVNTVNGVPQVWIKNLAQGEPVQITSGGAPAARPRWSPKNDQIVFGRGQEIWSVAPLGGPARRIIDSGRNPSFSADGERLVFERGLEIWVARADGSDAHRVQGAPDTYFTMDSLPSFSPDGKWIVSFRSEIGPHGDVWVIPAEGGKARRLTFDTRTGSGPIWTPDGRWIIYSSSRAGSTTLWRVAVAGGTPEPLTTGAGEDTEPALSADGKRLIYTNARNSWALVLLDPATGQSKELLERRTEVLFPVFSPAGDRIAFFHMSTPQVFTIAVDGTDLRQITQGKGEMNIMPSWSSDGSSLYFYRVWPTKSFLKISLAGGSSTEVATWPVATHGWAQEGPSGRQLAYTLVKDMNASATVLRDLSTGQEKRLAVPLHELRWSPDGASLVGQLENGQIAICPTSGASCTTLTKGMKPVWDASGSKIYFIRLGNSRSQPQDLWSLDLKTRTEKKVATVGPFRMIDIHFDLSRSGQIITAPFREGRSELWLAEIKR